MAIAKGLSLGPYEILSHLGSGGMGEVWRARDRRIGRDVAIKVLPEAFDARDERLQRFEQEARAAGGLNHPGLVTIFDVGTTDGSPYIVMELLEGQTLRDTLGDPGGPLPLRKAIDHAIQLARALAVAHEKGIIHRDLKPENIFITSDRRVKILDFGLAKLAPEAKETADAGRRTSRHLTSAGIAVGTPGYMSPEQVRAAPIDHRTDIFSLGSVLYEMLTGQTAFERFTAVETMHAVLRDEPPELDPAKFSPTLIAIVHHCLEKDARERFQSARDLAFHLQMLPELQRSGSGMREVTLPRRRVASRAALIVLPLLLAGAAAGFALRAYRGDATTSAPRAFRQLTSADGMELFPTLAPDGKSFAYVSSQSGNRDIYVQRVDGRTAINITADWADDDSEPAFSPDGSQIAFRSERDGGGIFVMGATGESPRRLTDFGRNPAWSPDGTRLAFATERVELLPYSRGRASELWVVDVRSGARHALVQAKKGGPDFGFDSDCVQPSWSPGGKRIAVWGIAPSGRREIWTLDPNAPEPKKTVVRATADTALHWNPVWSPDGRYLYYGSDRDGTVNLWRMPIDEETGSPAGAPEPVALPAPFTGNFAFAPTGELAYVAVTSSYRVLAMSFEARTGAVGSPRQLVGGSQEILGFQPSPDGRSVAYGANTGTQEDLFVAEGLRIRQLTSDPARDRSPRWSPDGKTLYFYSNRGGKAYHIWSIRTDGSGLTRITDDAELQRAGARDIYTPDVSPDGRTLIASTDQEKTVLVHLDRPHGQRVEALPVFLPSARWSPDGQFIVAKDERRTTSPQRGAIDALAPVTLYSLRTGRMENLSSTGASPHWTPDGKKVVYFERQQVGILDLESRASMTVPFTVFLGAPVDLTGARLSQDARTLYVRQAVEQGDIWIVRLPK